MVMTSLCFLKDLYLFFFFFSFLNWSKPTSYRGIRLSQWMLLEPMMIADSNMLKMMCISFGSGIFKIIYLRPQSHVLWKALQLSLCMSSAFKCALDQIQWEEQMLRGRVLCFRWLEHMTKPPKSLQNKTKESKSIPHVQILTKETAHVCLLHGKHTCATI